jgi:predicted phosphoribosyltransferase
VLFDDRVDAAKQLAVRLKDWLDINVARQGEQLKHNTSVILLAIPRGGVVVGDVIASMLGIKLDIILSRKIGAPNNPELAIGAVMPDGSYSLNTDIADTLNVPQSYIDEQVSIQNKEIQRRLMMFKGKEVDDYYNDNFEGKTVILVDDGIATGATILAAANWLRTKHNCCKISMIAVPVAPPDVIHKINESSYEVLVLHTPEIFGSVGRFYKNFEQVSDTQVRVIMIKHGYRTL